MNDFYLDSEGTVHVKLSNADEELLCDQDDWEKLCKYTWHKDSRGYARTDIVDGYLLFHLCVISKKPEQDVDHIYGNKLDNRKKFLRACTHKENCRNRCHLNKNNTSKARGVVWRKREQKWMAQIVVDGKKMHLGYFDNFEDAVSHRKAAEKKYFGTLEVN